MPHTPNCVRNKADKQFEQPLAGNGSFENRRPGKQRRHSTDSTRAQELALKCLSSHGSTTSIPGLLSHSNVALIWLQSLSNARLAWSSCSPLSPVWPCKLGSFEIEWLPLPWRSFLERESPSMRSQQQYQRTVSLPVGGSANCPWSSFNLLT